MFWLEKVEMLFTARTADIYH